MLKKIEYGLLTAYFLAFAWVRGMEDRMVQVLPMQQCTARLASDPLGKELLNSKIFAGIVGRTFPMGELRKLVMPAALRYSLRCKVANKLWFMWIESCGEFIDEGGSWPMLTELTQWRACLEVEEFFSQYVHTVSVRTVMESDLGKRFSIVKDYLEEDVDDDTESLCRAIVEPNE